MRQELALGDVTISFLTDAGAADTPTSDAPAAGAARPTVVFLHGLAGSAAEFLPTAAALGAGYNSVLVELRGHGRSTRHPADASREAYVRDVIAVLEHLNASESTEPAGVALVGQSMGAHTALLVAAARPDLVRMLVLLEGDVQSSPPEAAERIGGYFASWPVPFADAAAASAFLGDSVIGRAWLADLEPCEGGLRPRFEPAFLQASIAALHAQARWEEWENLTVPTAAVFAPDGMFDEERKLAFLEARPGTLRVDLGAGSHDAHLDATAEWSAVLGDLLSRLDGDGPVRWDWD
ncbi:alpha/beta fold hydrolase [Microterricola pindariensis]|uniref:alpha/beta fold hydrolase n=1 Tax=Microterricola pindariensis TaxID=478010 RepID=UPI000CEC5A36|nr:alpha/beta hydrolase [Microterricola pindariensis]